MWFDFVYRLSQYSRSHLGQKLHSILLCSLISANNSTCLSLWWNLNLRICRERLKLCMGSPCPEYFLRQVLIIHLLQLPHQQPKRLMVVIIKSPNVLHWWIASQWPTLFLLHSHSHIGFSGGLSLSPTISISIDLKRTTDWLRLVLTTSLRRRRV